MISAVRVVPRRLNAADRHAWQNKAQVRQVQVALAAISNKRALLLSNQKDIEYEAHAVDSGELRRIAGLVVDYQLDRYDEATNSVFQNGRDASGHPCSWLHGSFYLGFAESAASFGAERYWDHIVKIGERNDWRLGPRFAHADDYVIGQAYLEVYEHKGIEAAAGGVRKRLQEILQSPPVVELKTDAELDPPVELEGYIFDDSGACKTRWSWCDSLHMAPPLWIHLAKLDNDPRYLAYADSEYWKSWEHLYDERWSLFHRDSRFIPPSGHQADVSFWSRGNGWVLLGLRRIIDRVPAEHPSRERYVELFKAMANRVAMLQSPTGFWPSKLSTTSSASTDFETSGTAMFVAALSWGLRHGLLEQSKIEPVVGLGWQALTSAIYPDGKVGWVQGIDDRPRPAEIHDSHIYGSGAVLHACAELNNLVNTQTDGTRS